MVLINGLTWLSIFFVLGTITFAGLIAATWYLVTKDDAFQKKLSARWDDLEKRRIAHRKVMQEKRRKAEIKAKRMDREIDPEENVRTMHGG